MRPWWSDQQLKGQRMRTLLYIFGLTFFVASMNQVSVLRKYIVQGPKRVRMFWLFPIGIKNVITDKNDLVSIRLWRFLGVVSFVGLIACFIILAVTA